MPLYHQIKQDIKEKIETNVWKVGDKLPNEVDLAHDYGVSRLTVRNAITQLVQEGLVKRQQGRGTFVTLPRLESKPQRVTSFFIEMKSKGFDPTSIVLDLKVINCDSITASHLDLKQWEKVVKLQRLRIVNGEPIAYQTNYIREKFVPGITDINFERQSLQKCLEDKYGLVQSHAIEKIRAQGCDEETAKFLNLKPGDPILYVERIVLLMDETPLLLAHTLFNGERYTYVASLFSSLKDNEH
jgi:GntR family transcriptional regulator